LKSLARHHLGTGSRIWPFLPPGWVKGPGVGTITFGELLTHRAGFRLDSGLVFATGDAAREQISHGVQRIDQRVADYNNIDFTIFRDMLPFMQRAPQPGQPRAPPLRTAFSSAMCSVRYSTRWASPTPGARRAIATASSRALA
jgi:CubicO group peptidase (beta-lactamase class C family)